MHIHMYMAEHVSVCVRVCVHAQDSTLQSCYKLEMLPFQLARSHAGQKVYRMLVLLTPFTKISINLVLDSPVQWAHTLFISTLLMGF